MTLRLLSLWMFYLRVIPVIYKQIQVFHLEDEEANILYVWHIAISEL